MDIAEENISVAMLRDKLKDIPVYPMPDRYTIYRYAIGDEHTWVRIQSAADKYNKISLELFYGEFGRDPAPISQRQLYLIDPQGEAVGTATAWYDEEYHGERWGRIHWVAIHPDYQGRGLARPLMSRVCQRLRDLGHRKAYLTTSSARIPAINLYLKFGFVPDIRSAEDRAVWEQIESHIRNR